MKSIIKVAVITAALGFVVAPLSAGVEDWGPWNNDGDGPGYGGYGPYGGGPRYGPGPGGRSAAPQAAPQALDGPGYGGYGPYGAGPGYGYGPGGRSAAPQAAPAQ